MPVIIVGNFDSICKKTTKNLFLGNHFLWLFLGLFAIMLRASQLNFETGILDVQDKLDYAA